MKNKDIFDKLVAGEDAFYTSQFFAPVIRNKPVRVRIDGVICDFMVTRPRNFEGWAVLQANGPKEARQVRKPTESEKKRYLDVFPVLRFILCNRSSKQWFGFPAAQSDNRFRITGTMPINLAEEVQLFDVVQVRYDGVVCWFDCVDPKHSSRRADYLRESLINLVEPKNLEFTGLTQEEFNCYQLAYAPALAADIESKKDHTEETLKKAVNHAGAVFRNYIERDSGFTIEYDVDGERHRSTVNKVNLQVVSAGICLNHTDSQFDLTSLVSVIREAQDRNLVHRM